MQRITSLDSLRLTGQPADGAKLYTLAAVGNQRLCAHLAQQRNDTLAYYMKNYRLAFRCDRIVENDLLDWPRTVEAYLLKEFESKFGALPMANRRRETIPKLPLDLFILNQQHFNFVARG